MKALLFPGQGSQIVGMGSEFYNNFDYVKKIFAEADEKLKFKISKIILEGPDQDLKLTQNTQPAILTVSYAIFQTFKKEFGFKVDEFQYFAGHSLGEYSALVCAESLNFNDALYLVHERGKEMQNAVPAGEGAMLAVLGTDIDKITNLINQLKNKKVCEIANDNSKGQTIISGDIVSINHFVDLLKQNRIKFIKLPVSAPFHCSLMKTAAEKMQDKIKLTNFKSPLVEIITNVNASPETDPNIIKGLLIKQIYSKVRWRESILHMQSNNIKEFIEIGPGKVLAGLVKRINSELNTLSINSINDIKNINK
jgi:[acyl-carrier-protein] S-malonyltransferase|tara:strand:+ start:893 stop:1819 length:927 start_codon:yes stop_codon:yes gene_type:complete